MRGAVLQVITDTDRRGAQLFGVALGEELVRRGWTVSTVALTSGMSERPLEVATLGRYTLAPTTLAGIRAAARSADVVIAHGSRTLPACALATTATGVPFVYRSIGDPRYWASSPGRRARVRLALGRAGAVTALWPGAAQALVNDLGVPADRVVTIPNGVPSAGFEPSDRRQRAAARRTLGLPEDVTTLLYLGALTPEKHVEAVIAVTAELPDVQLLVVGDGPLRPRLASTAQESAPGRVRILGLTDRTQLVLSAADVIVLPSRSEGMPAVLIEAGLSGVPAVATDVGGIREIVEQGVTGHVVPVGDVAALADAVRAILQDRTRYGAAARRRCLERFTIGPVADAWSALLEAVATGRVGPAEAAVHA